MDGVLCFHMIFRTQTNTKMAFPFQSPSSIAVSDHSGEYSAKTFQVAFSNIYHMMSSSDDYGSDSDDERDFYKEYHSDLDSDNESDDVSDRVTGSSMTERNERESAMSKRNLISNNSHSRVYQLPDPNTILKIELCFPYLKGLSRNELERQNAAPNPERDQQFLLQSVMQYQIQAWFHKEGRAPRVHVVKHFPFFIKDVNTSVIFSATIMEKIDFTLRDVVMRDHDDAFIKQVFSVDLPEMLTFLVKHQVCHGNFELGNIAFKDKQMQLIDFKQTSQVRQVDADIAWLIRDIVILLHQRDSKRWGDLLVQSLHMFCNGVKHLVQDSMSPGAVWIRAIANDSRWVTSKRLNVELFTKLEKWHDKLVRQFRNKLTQYYSQHFLEQRPGMTTKLSPHVSSLDELVNELRQSGLVWFPEHSEFDARGEKIRGLLEEKADVAEWQAHQLPVYQHQHAAIPFMSIENVSPNWMRDHFEDRTHIYDRDEDYVKKIWTEVDVNQKKEQQVKKKQLQQKNRLEAQRDKRLQEKKKQMEAEEKRWKQIHQEDLARAIMKIHDNCKRWGMPGDVRLGKDFLRLFFGEDYPVNMTKQQIMAKYAQAVSRGEARQQASLRQASLRQASLRQASLRQASLRQAARQERQARQGHTASNRAWGVDFVLQDSHLDQWDSLGDDYLGEDSL